MATLLSEITKGKLNAVKDKFEILFHRHYANKYSKEQIEYLYDGFETTFFDLFLEVDPTKNKKYINWFYNLFKRELEKGVAVSGFKRHIQRNKQQIREYLTKFHEAKRFDFPDEIAEYKDINKFEDIHDFILFMRENDEFNSMIFKNDIQESTKKIYFDDNVMVLQAESFKAMCQIGKKTAFCNSKLKADFQNYKMKGISLLIVNKDISSETKKVGNETLEYKDPNKIIQVLLPFDFSDLEIRRSDNTAIEYKEFVRNNSDYLKDIIEPYLGEISKAFSYYTYLIINRGDVDMTDKELTDKLSRKDLNRVYQAILNHYLKYTSIRISPLNEVDVDNAIVSYQTGASDNNEFGMFNFDNPFSIFNNVLLFKENYVNIDLSERYDDLGYYFRLNLDDIDDFHGIISQYINDAYNKSKFKEVIGNRIKKGIAEDTIRMYDILEENEDNYSVDLENDDNYINQIKFESILDYFKETDTELYEFILKSLVMKPYIMYLYNTVLDMKNHFKNKKQSLPSGLEVTLLSASVNFNSNINYTFEVDKRNFLKFIFKHKDVDVEFFEGLLEDLFNSHPDKDKFDIVNNIDDIKVNLLKFVD